MNRKTFTTALGCALLATTLLGCGGSNKLQSITLTAGGQSGTVNLKGIGGTLQFKATGNYSSTKTHDLTNVVTYSVIPDPNGSVIPPLPPLTVTMNPTGMMTAVEPAICLWHDSEPNPDVDNKPAWSITGSYIVTATFQGVTSQQMFIPVASATGDGPQGACGP